MLLRLLLEHFELSLLLTSLMFQLFSGLLRLPLNRFKLSLLYASLFFLLFSGLAFHRAHLLLDLVAELV